MRIAVEVLRRELVQLSVLQRFHLMYQAYRDVHAFAGSEFEFFQHLRFRRSLDPNLKTARAQVERFGLELVKVQRAALALADLEDLATIQIAIDNPYLAPPSLRHDVDWSACAVHRRFTLPFIEGYDPAKGYVHPAKLHCYPVYHD